MPLPAHGGASASQHALWQSPCSCPRKRRRVDDTENWKYIKGKGGIWSSSQLCSGDVPTTSHSQGRVPTTSHSQGRVPTTSHSQGRVPTTSHSQGRVPTTSHSQGRVPTTSHSQGRVPTTSHSQGRVPTTSHSQGESYHPTLTKKSPCRGIAPPAEQTVLD